MIELDDSPVDVKDVCPTCMSIMEDMIAEGNLIGDFTCPDCGEEVSVCVGSFDPRSPDFISDVVNHLSMQMVEDGEEITEDLRRDLEHAALHMWEASLGEMSIDSEDN